MEKVFLVPTACNGSLTTCRPYQCVKPNVLWIGMTTGRVRAGFLHSRTPPMGLDPRHGFGPIINQVFFSGPRPAPPAPFSPRPKSWPNQKKIWMKPKFIFVCHLRLGTAFTTNTKHNIHNFFHNILQLHHKDSEFQVFKRQ